MAAPRADRVTEVGANGRGNDVEGNLVGWPNPQERLFGKHEGSNIQRRFGGTRDPRSINRNQFLQSLKKILDGKLRERHPLRGSLQAKSVLVRPESPDGAIFMTVALHSLEDLLTVMKH